jgi:hypothetical protein
MPLLLTALAAIALLVFLAGCGSGSSSSSEASTTSGSPSSESNNPLSGGPSSFIEPNNPNNKYAKFGKEASAAQREAASAVLAENLEARESGDFATQCATLNAAGVKELAGSKKPSPETCAAGLKKLAEPLKNTEEIRADTFDGQIDVFRVKGTKGYALYHGTDGNNWMMSMVEEGGAWKVGAIIAIEVG